ncbi:MAG: periplasmic heavy metal sensor [Candidatus Krumholzibacteria bacterium]|nr:periplasmic heavy metal sensor [Candidatus Krumholzibacteria bacterium]
MSKRIIYLLLAVSLGVNVGVVATTLLHRPAGPPPGPDGDRGPGQRPDAARMVEQHVQGITRHLDLDEEQQQTIRSVMEHHAPQLIMLQSQAEAAGGRLTEAFAAPEFDPDLFRQMTAEAAVARSRVDSLSAVMLVAEAAVLTPEQRRKFAQVAPSIHSKPQLRPREDGPPPREDGPPPR